MKKIIAIVMVVVLALTAVIGTTMAYFTDEAEASNVMVVGNVDITLNETDRNNNPFKQNQELLPSVGDLTDTTGDGYWDAENVIDKKVTVTNTGKSDAYVRVWFAFEKSDLMHINKNESDWTWTYVEDATINGQECEIWVATYNSELAPGATTTASLMQVALDSSATNDDVKALGGTYEVEVVAQAVQADGFTDAKTALDTAFTASSPWATETDAEGGKEDDYSDAKSLAETLADATKDIVVNVSGAVSLPTAGHSGAEYVNQNGNVTLLGEGTDSSTLVFTGEGVSAVAANGGTLTVKDMTVVDNSVSYAEDAWEFTYLELGGDLYFENVVFTSGIMLEADANATFVNCKFITNEESVYGVWVLDGSATFTDCTFTGTRGLKICDMYNGNEVDTVVVDGCTFSNLTKKPGVAIDDENVQDMDITIKNSTFINCQAGEQDNYIYETDNTVPTLENNTVRNDVEDIHGLTTDAEGNYHVTTAEALSYFSAKALTSNNGTAETATIYIDADINMNGASFSAVIAQRGDTLNIIGNGHTISNVNVVSGDGDNTSGQASMFYCFPNSTLNVENLTLSNITVTSDEVDSGYAAAVVGYCEGTANLTNVDVVNATVTGAKSSGMLVGHLSGALNATGCDVSGTVTITNYNSEEGGHYAGKYIGTLAGTASLNTCTADVTLSGLLKDSNVGDIYGRKVSGSITVNGAAYVSTTDELQAAIKAGTSAITLADGEYQLYGSYSTNAAIKITGSKNAVIDLTWGAYAENATLTFEGITIEGSTGYVTTNGTNYGSDYAALYSKNVTYIDCTYVNGFRIGRDGASFQGCTFELPTNHYVWTYGNDATFTGCTFNTAGKALLIYKDGGTEISQVTVTGCTFNATQADATPRGAIEISNYGCGVNLTTSGNTHDSNFCGEWRIKDYDSAKATVTVNGIPYAGTYIDGVAF